MSVDVPLLALLAMIGLVLLTKIPVAVAMHRTGPRGYDNRTPRRQQAALTGWGARALAAHQNTFEALVIFTAAIVVMYSAGGPKDLAKAATLAVVHTVARILYPVFYIADVHIVRSLVWAVAFGSALWLAMLSL